LELARSGRQTLARPARGEITLAAAETLPPPPLVHPRIRGGLFRRGYEIRELYDLVTAPAGAPIILYFGQTGVGKSSVLEAGLLPRLEANREVRCDVRCARRDRALDLLQTLARELILAGGSTDLGTAWRGHEAAGSSILFLILDQV